MTTAVYVAVGICCTLCLRIKKGVSVILPLVFLGCGELKVVFGDVIACELRCAVGSEFVYDRLCYTDYSFPYWEAPVTVCN